MVLGREIHYYSESYETRVLIWHLQYNCCLILEAAFTLNSFMNVLLMDVATRHHDPPCQHHLPIALISAIAMTNTSTQFQLRPQAFVPYTGDLPPACVMPSNSA